MPFQGAQAQAERPLRSQAVKSLVGFGSLGFYSQITSPKTHRFWCSGSSLDPIDNLLCLAPLSCPLSALVVSDRRMFSSPPFLTFLFVAAHSLLCLACYLQCSKALNNHFPTHLHLHPSQTTCTFMSSQPIRQNRTLELLTPSPSAKGLGSHFKPIYISIHLNPPSSLWRKYSHQNALCPSHSPSILCLAALSPVVHLASSLWPSTALIS